MKNMPYLPHLTFLALLVTSPVTGQSVDGLEDRGTLDLRVLKSKPDSAWDARAVEHLFNRAGFGAHNLDLRRGLRTGQKMLVGHLIRGEDEGPRFVVRPVEPDMEMLKGGDEEERRKERNRLRNDNRRQGQEFLNWWVSRMLEGQSPLRERMTLFWHGFFTSDSTKVRLAELMIDQNELLREHALGNFGELLHAVVRDPAMLIYLDNTSNTKDSPNENLARELMELFSLGEGNYTEEDIREVARALTGYGIDRRREFVFNARAHDFTTKTILGVEGRHDGRDVVDILLAQPACARWVAGSIITYLEGAAPDQERLEAYAEFLREADYELGPMLEKLLLDPEFYRDEIVGARVSSPIDYLVGACRRLGADVRGELIVRGAGLLGMSLFEPPNVKGWNEGPAWITTATLMNRANLAGVLLGTIGAGEMLVDPLDDMELTEEEMASMGPEFPLDEAMMGDGEMMTASAEVEKEKKSRNQGNLMAKVARAIGSGGHHPRISLGARLFRSGASSDREIVEFMCSSLLAIDAPLETRRMLVAALRTDREAQGIEPGALVKKTMAAEQVLRRLAHLILSLPEAQLG
ncbi:MAG: hypothetical protein CMJ98_05465 [Planctomycetes bacterium]|nr:hypothetical protein [Planctomycetota bacterium]